MSVMERRLQLLLDQDRYDRVAAEAQRSGRSVAAVIREAIDARFPDRDPERGEALRQFLTMTQDADEGPGESWAEMKAIYDDELAAKFDRLESP